MVPQVFARSPSLQPSPPPLFPSLPFIPETIVQASSFGPLHIPGQKQKPFLTPMTRPAVILSGMWRLPRVGWGACMLPIYILACQLQGEQGLGWGKALRSGEPRTTRFQERRERVREGPQAQGSQARGLRPTQGHERIQTHADQAQSFTPPCPCPPPLVSHLV